MVLEALSSVLAGLVLALVAVRRWPRRFPQRGLALVTGPAAGLLGAVLIRGILGPDHGLVGLLAAAVCAVAMLSLLVSTRVRPRPMLSARS